MVRLEKIAYYRIINSSTLGRARVIGRPRKWHQVNPFMQNRKNFTSWANSIVGKILSPFFNWVTEFEMRWQRDLFLQQGLTFEDKYVHEEQELRRDVLFEHIFRESLHPYHWLLKVKRRERYYKVERGLRGFFVPQHVRQEAETQTLATAIKLHDEWTEFVHNNYFSDITPRGRGTAVPKLIPLEWPMISGFMSAETWDQYFYNEKNPRYYTEKDLKDIKNHRYPYNLTTNEGKRQFEAWLTAFNERNPGIALPPGQKPDFKTYYQRLGV